MVKVIKWTGAILGILILLLFLSVAILATCVNPNKIKPIITSRVFELSGRQLTIDGDLAWSFFPYLGVKIGHATLGNLPEFKQQVFAEFNQATLGVKLLPLFHANIEASGLTLSGLTLNLIKNADGKTNWQDLLRPKAMNNNEVKTEVAANHSNKKFAIGLAVQSIDINDAHISWVNLQTAQSTDISHFDFHAKDIGFNHSFPIDSHFNFDVKNPNLSGESALSAKVTFNISQQLYVFQNLTWDVKAKQNAKNIHINIVSDITGDLAKQTLKIDNLVNKFENLIVTGNVKLSQLTTHPQMTGHLLIEPFDLKQLLQKIGQDTTNIQTTKNLSADLNFSVDDVSNGKGDHKVDVQGNIRAEELQVAEIKLTQLDIAMRLHNGELDFTPITGLLYQGKLQSQAKIIFSGATPLISLQANLTGVQAEPLLQDLGAAQDKIKLMGVGNIQLQVTTAGLAADSIKRNLNGTVRFSFNDGKLDGINVGYMIDTAYALLKGKPTPPENEKSTHFGNLTGTAMIQNGVITNKDLFMNSPRFDTSGQGTINLVNQQINYTLEAMPKLANEDDSNPLSLNHLAIPVRITGSLQDPVIVPDTAAIAKEIGNAEIKKAQNRLQNKIQEQVKSKLSGQANNLLKNILGN